MLPYAIFELENLQCPEGSAPSDLFLLQDCNGCPKFEEFSPSLGEAQEF
jgi:hypothetical protein